MNNKLIALNILVGFLASCGAKTTTIARSPLPTIQDTGSGDIPTDPIDEYPDGPLPESCVYWESLAGEGPMVAGQAFQLFDAIELMTPDKNLPPVMFGRHNLRDMPQVLYKLSKEANDGSKPVDPPNLAEFRKILDKKHDDGEIGFLKYKMVQLLFLSGRTKKLLKIRNEAVQEKIEESLPGAFTDALGSLEKDKIFTEYLESSGLSNAAPEQLLALSFILKRRVPLFTSDDWIDRTRDLGTTLSLLYDSASKNRLSGHERTCRFALKHRLMAQILTLKGFSGAPELNENGRLPGLPHKDNRILPETDVLGLYGNVIDADWIDEQIKHPGLRPAGLEGTSEFFDYLGYLIKLTRNRDPDLWAFADKPVPAGQIRLPAELLRLGVGLFAFNLKIMADEELVLDVPKRITVREDSNENFTKLGNAALDITDSFETLAEPNEIEQEIFSDKARAAFLKPYPDGVIAKMQRLSFGIAFEGLLRIKNGEQSFEMNQMLRRTGRKLNWGELANLP